MLDAYQNLLESLCQYGLPTEDLYEFAALSMLKHEKKLKLMRKKELEERLKKRNEEKEKLAREAAQLVETDPKDPKGKKGAKVKDLKASIEVEE